MGGYSLESAPRNAGFNSVAYPAYLGEIEYTYASPKEVKLILTVLGNA